MKPGLYLEEISEVDYHNDALGEGLRLSCSIAQALVLESAAHAYLRHPKLGGQPMVPTNDMDRGSLIHALLLGKGRELAIVECQDWKKPGNRELRDQHRAEGKLAVHRKLYDESIEAAQALKAKLEAKGYVFDGDSEATILWNEYAVGGANVACRGRLDHVKGPEIWDLKITADANPRTLTRGHITRMGYDIQGAAYPRALESADPRFRGRCVYTLLFCEPEPPYCVTPIRFGGSLKELGARKWQRGVDRWYDCLSSGTWPDYCDDVVFAEARPYELEEFESVA